MFAVIALLVAASAGGAPALQRSASQDTAATRKQIEAWYEQNKKAYAAWDLPAVMALRAAGFHAITPDGATQDRVAMERYTEGFLNGVKKWNIMNFTIDSLRVARDTASAIVSQHLDRMALRPDNAVHHVETWVTQRETWIRVQGKWLLWRVDQLRNQRRVVDGKPG